MASKRENRVRGFATKPAVPQQQGPGPLEADFTIDSEAIRSLDGTKTGDLGLATDGGAIEAAWAALVQAVPSAGAFFGRATVEGYDETRLLRAMRVYGHYRNPDESLAMGDIARVGHAQSGGTWMLVLSAAGRDVSEAVMVDTKDEWKFALVSGSAISGPAADGWQPVPSKVIDSTSQIGAFWGPNLGLLRSVLYDTPDSYIATELAEDSFSLTAYDTSTLEALLGQLESEALVLDGTQQLPAWPGSIVFRDDDDSFGVVMGARTVFGSTGSPGLSFMGWDKFAPKYIWYPHL